MMEGETVVLLQSLQALLTHSQSYTGGHPKTVILNPDQTPYVVE